MEYPSNDDGALLAAAMQLSIEKRNKHLETLKDQHFCPKGFRCPVKFSSLVFTSELESHTIQFKLAAYKEVNTVIRNTDEINIKSIFLGAEGSIVCPCKSDCSEHVIQTICNICSK